MDQKLTLRRLTQLYADLDLPAFKPAEHPLQIDPEPESLPSLLEGQSPDVVVLPEASQIEFTHAGEAAEIPDVSVLPRLADPGPEVIFQPEADVGSGETAQFPDVSTSPTIGDPIPAPVQVTGFPDRPSKTDEPGQADWRAIGIGVVTGSLVSGIILLVTSQMHIFNNPGRLALWAGEMFLGVLGALIANSWKSTARDLWRASIEWALFPLGFALLIGFILLLLTYTSLTG